MIYTLHFRKFYLRVLRLYVAKSHFCGFLLQFPMSEANPATSSPLPAAMPERRMATYIALGLIVAVVCAYAMIVRADFIVYDDNSHVFENPGVTGGLTWHGIADAFTKPRASLWVPLTWISFMLDVSLFGLNPGAMHAVNLAWHAASTVLLFYTLRSMTGRLWPSAFVAALFGLHPLNVESVAWITERKNVLCAFFWIATISAYARYAVKPRATTFILAGICAALGLLSKPMAVTLPCTLVLLDFWPLRRVGVVPAWRLAVEKAPFFGLTVLASWLALRAQRSSAVVSFETVTFAGRVSNALISYATYLGKLLWPMDLGVFYPHPVDPQPMLATAAAALLVAITFAAWRMWKTSPYVLIGWFWFLGTLVPMIGLVQVGSQARADRFTYIAQLGIFFAFAWLLADRSPKPSRALAAAAGAVLLACGIVTAHQVTYWLDGVTLFEHTIAVTKDNACAQANAGLHRARAGDPLSAIQHYQASLRIQPDQSMIWREFGAALVKIGHPGEAVAMFRKGLEYDPADLTARYQLGLALRQTGAVDEAIETFDQIIRDVPRSAGAHYQLSLALKSKGRNEEARQHLLEAARLAPNDPEIAAAAAEP